MKPLNLDNSPCSPISSNCILWQGPDIPCINLCTGDTVSDVIHALATELCCVLTVLDINSYDLSCFNATTSKPDDFKAFIQFLTEKICELEGIPNHVHDPNTEGDCPTGCVVTVAEPFRTPESKTMNLVDYTVAIGNKIVTIIDDINLNKASIADHEVRIVSLEVAPPPTFTLPSITPSCVLPSVPIPIDQVLSALESAFCSFLSSTGTGAALTLAVGKQCAGLNTSPSKVNPANGMAVEYTGIWISSAVTLADSVNNLWITLCDIRNAQAVTLAKLDTDTIELTLTAGPAYVISAEITDTGWVDLEGFSYYTGVNKPQCRKIGKTIHFRGLVIPPLSSTIDGLTLVNLATPNTYTSQPFPHLYTGAGGLTVNANDVAYFNNDTPVVPNSVLPGNFDGEYSLGRIIAYRNILLSDGLTGTSLSSVFVAAISADKKLYISSLKDIEEVPGSTGSAFGSNPQRLITSHVRVGEYVPNYIALASDIHNAPSYGGVASIGGLIVGTGYFTATDVPVTGGTGTDMTVDITAVAGNITSATINYPGSGYTIGDTVKIAQVGSGYDGTVDILTVLPNFPLVADRFNLTWPFTCNAGTSRDLAGFAFRLDGLIAYI